MRSNSAAALRAFFSAAQRGRLTQSHWHAPAGVRVPGTAIAADVALLDTLHYKP